MLTVSDTTGATRLARQQWRAWIETAIAGAAALLLAAARPPAMAGVD